MTAAPRVDMAGRSVIVTGATPGSLGYETARILRDWGAQVTVTTRRDPSAAAAALGVPAHALDLCDAASVREFATAYTSTVGRLDVLVNNAGVHLDLRKTWKSPPQVDGFEVHWRTNYLGTAHLTHLLMPLLSTAVDPRVVNVVSKLHNRATNADLFQPRTPYDSWNAYGASKLALMHHVFELQRRCAPVQGYALHPGSVYTHIADRGLAGQRLIGMLRRVAAPLERRMLLTPEAGAQTTLLCAAAPSVSGGRYYRDVAEATPAPDALDATVSARLWDETQTWLATQA
jgi:NAD(P)-dependent dehydrogenase (short-subunit alcohol dehydrogenase family)